MPYHIVESASKLLFEERLTMAVYMGAQVVGSTSFFESDGGRRLRQAIVCDDRTLEYCNIYSDVYSVFLFSVHGDKMAVRLVFPNILRAKQFFSNIQGKEFIEPPYKDIQGLDEDECDDEDVENYFTHVNYLRTESFKRGKQYALELLTPVVENIDHQFNYDVLERLSQFGAALVIGKKWHYATEHPADHIVWTTSDTYGYIMDLHNRAYRAIPKQMNAFYVMRVSYGVPDGYWSDSANAYVDRSQATRYNALEAHATASRLHKINDPVVVIRCNIQS